MEPTFDLASFKDPEGWVFHRDGRVFRALSASACERLKGYADNGLLGDLVDQGLLIQSRFIDEFDVAAFGRSAVAAVMEHDRVPFISYPHEWCFSQLKDSALLTLHLLRVCLERGVILKDATAYNVQLYNGAPVFIDTLSLDDYCPGETWAGYRQYCMEFLYPLMLKAYCGVDFQPFLVGPVNGIRPADMNALLGPSKLIRSGVFKHVYLHARMDRDFRKSNVKVADALIGVDLGKDVILSNVKNLTAVTEGLRPNTDTSEWTNYTATRSYTDQESAKKREFVERLLAKQKWTCIVDLGCNTGEFSLLAAKHADQVLAFDVDAESVDSLYRHIAAEGLSNIVPLIADITRPSPGIGWANTERAALRERWTGDFFLALALIHHVCISGNVPISHFVDELAKIAPRGVLEWVDKEDEMVKVLLTNRRDVFDDYAWPAFEEAVTKHFAIESCVDSHGGRRRLCYLGPK